MISLAHTSLSFGFRSIIFFWFSSRFLQTFPTSVSPPVFKQWFSPRLFSALFFHSCGWSYPLPGLYLTSICCSYCQLAPESRLDVHGCTSELIVFSQTPPPSLQMTTLVNFSNWFSQARKLGSHTLLFSSPPYSVSHQIMSVFLQKVPDSVACHCHSLILGPSYFSCIVDTSLCYWSCPLL